MSQQVTPWLVRSSRFSNAPSRVFCVPFAGVGPSAFRGWTQALDPDIEAIFVHLPGREVRLRERPLDSLSEIVGAAADALTPNLDRPFALFGHSLGGLIAFELARELRTRGLLQPMHLFVSAARAPHLPYPYPALRRAKDEDLLHQVNTRYENSIPRQILECADLRELFVPALRADFSVLETYAFHSEPPLDCPISVFGGTGDGTLSLATLDAWRIHTRHQFRLRLLSEGHLFLQSSRATLVDAIRHELTMPARRPQAVGE